jgi:CheY-like chemotaxis protein
VSGADDGADAVAAGAVQFLEKPVDGGELARLLEEIGRGARHQVRRVLVVHAGETAPVAEALGHDAGIEVLLATDAEEALALLEGEAVDCLVADLELEQGTAYALIESVRSREHLETLPVVAYTSRELTAGERTRLGAHAGISVSQTSTPDQLLTDLVRFLEVVKRQAGGRRPADARSLPSEIFRGRTALIVDDDVRNVFALTSVLEAKGMEVVYAENGAEGVRILVENPLVDIVLMDVMMPEMDGYETIDAIRKMPEFASLPIIAVTAKAMKGDRERAIASGASSYITKPVDTDELLALMGVWLYPVDVPLLDHQDA